MCECECECECESLAGHCWNEFTFTNAYRVAHGAMSYAKVLLEVRVRVRVKDRVQGPGQGQGQGQGQGEGPEEGEGDEVDPGRTGWGPIRGSCPMPPSSWRCVLLASSLLLSIQVL